MGNVRHQVIYAPTIFPTAATINTNFVLLGEAKVDDQPWYTVMVRSEVAEWLQQQHAELWHPLVTDRAYRVYSTYDISESLYLLMMLRWS